MRLCGEGDFSQVMHVVHVCVSALDASSQVHMHSQVPVYAGLAVTCPTPSLAYSSSLTLDSR